MAFAAIEAQDPARAACSTQALDARAHRRRPTCSWGRPASASSSRRSRCAKAALCPTQPRRRLRRLRGLPAHRSGQRTPTCACSRRATRATATCRSSSCAARSCRSPSSRRSRPNAAFLIFPQADVSFPVLHPEAANALLKTLEEPRVARAFRAAERAARSAAADDPFALPARALRAAARAARSSGSSSATASPQSCAGRRSRCAGGRADRALAARRGRPRAAGARMGAAGRRGARAAATRRALLALGESCAQSDDRALVLESLAALLPRRRRDRPGRCRASSSRFASHADVDRGARAEARAGRGRGARRPSSSR